MDEPNTSPIEDKLREAWHQERRYIHMRGASRFALWLIALVALSFLIDWGILSRAELHGGVGLLLLLVNFGILTWVLWYEWLRHLKPFNPVIVALEVEERHPDLSSLLVSYVQLEKPRDDQPNVSSELIDAMRGQAISVSRPFNFGEIVDFRQLRNLFIAAIAVVLLAAAMSVQWKEHVGTLIQRLAGVDARYPTKTTVERVTDKIIVRVGDEANIVATASGIIPESGTLFTRPAEDEDAKWKALPLKRDADGNPTFSRTLKDLTSDLAYYVGIGDHKSAVYTLRVIPSPQINETHVDLTYPIYMKRRSLQSDQLNMEVPEGTKITWYLRSDTAVKRFEVKTDREGADPIVVEKDATGKNLTFSTTADEPFKYTFRWVEDESGRAFEFDDVQYGVRVVADTVPEVEMLRPRSNGRATLKKTLKIAARASDDHGLGKAWLVYSHDGDEEKDILIADFDGATGKEFTYEWKPADSIEDLKLLSNVTFAIKVSDLYPDEKSHHRRSATRQMTIVDKPDYLDWYRAELAAQNEEIKRTRSAEKQSSSKVKQIKVQEDETASVPESEPEPKS